MTIKIFTEILFSKVASTAPKNDLKLLTKRIVVFETNVLMKKEKMRILSLNVKFIFFMSKLSILHLVAKTLFAFSHKKNMGHFTVAIKRKTSILLVMPRKILLQLFQTLAISF